MLMTASLLTSSVAQASALTAQDRVLAIGDSLTAGFNVRPNESYPALLARRVPAKVLRATCS